MRNINHHYIDGSWVTSENDVTVDILDPSNREVSGRAPLGTVGEVNKAVQAARRALSGYAQSTVSERIALLNRIADVHEKRSEEMAQAVALDIGTPIELARITVGAGVAQFRLLAGMLREYPFATKRGSSRILKEPIGVCGLIPPWNYPGMQSAEKVAPALAAGCTVVLKPGTPYASKVLAEIVHEAGVPAGVFNMVHGRGSVIGSALSKHPDVDMVAFTGSTSVGVQVQRDAAQTIKRVTLELGGKSPYIILPDADLDTATRHAVAGIMSNSGQTCAAPSRTLIPRKYKDEIESIVRNAIDELLVGHPLSGVNLGPVANEAQWHTVQHYIRSGLNEGARLIAGGLGYPANLDHGWFVRPTAFSDVHNDMTIAREEIFGPVMTLICYDSIAEAVSIANDTPYGLAAYVNGSDRIQVEQVAFQLRAGQVMLNGALPDIEAPFGGFKQSGNGRIWGVAGLEEYLEAKVLVG